MNITCIGTGYVGLVTGTCFAELGNTVICVDNNVQKLEQLERHESPFYEPGLAERIERNRTAGRLHFTDDISSAVLKSDLVFIAVGTPSDDTGAADLSAVFAVAKAVIQTIKRSLDSKFRVLVTKSTVPVGTGQKIQHLVTEAGLTDEQLSVVSNPEFLREGSAIYDFFHPDRIVLGGNSATALEKVAALYDPLNLNETPIVKTSLNSSELSKYAANAFLATKISFINEMANLCEAVNADVQDVARIMGMDKRIGKFFLHPGPGYGGSCFPKDTKALVKIGEEYGETLSIVAAVDDRNDQQKTRHLAILKQVFNNDLSGKTITLLGASFKPETDDIREAPALKIIETLLEEGCKIQLFDPQAMPNCKAYFKDNTAVSFHNDSYDAALNADALLLVTEWNVFRELDLDKLKTNMKGTLFCDLRNVYYPETLRKHGFLPYTLGKALPIPFTINATPCYNPKYL